MSLRVNVELKDGAICMMAKKSFNTFLALERIATFKRASGWVVVGKDRLRDLEKINDYPFYAERRASS